MWNSKQQRLFTVAECDELQIARLTPPRATDRPRCLANGEHITRDRTQWNQRPSGSSSC